MNLTDARRTSDLMLTHDRIPVGEATELPFEEGWRQWDLAVTLNERALTCNNPTSPQATSST